MDDKDLQEQAGAALAAPALGKSARIFADMAFKVNEFQDRILGLPIVVGQLQTHRFHFKVDHMREEIAELVDAHLEGNFEAQVDALVDLIYVAMGALLEMGVPPEMAFNIVHEANMRKVRGTTRRGESFDAVKPEGWESPRHEALIERMSLLAQVRPALLEATRIMLERGAKYNGGSVRRADHFPFGVKSVFEAVWLKAIRMRADIECGRAVDRDHPRDLINYAGFMLDFIDGRDLG